MSFDLIVIGKKSRWGVGLFGGSDKERWSVDTENKNSILTPEGVSIPSDRPSHIFYPFPTISLSPPYTIFYASITLYIELLKRESDQGKLLLNV